MLVTYHCQRHKHSFKYNYI